MSSVESSSSSLVLDGRVPEAITTNAPDEDTIRHLLDRMQALESQLQAANVKIEESNAKIEALESLSSRQEKRAEITKDIEDEESQPTSSNGSETTDGQDSETSSRQGNNSQQSNIIVMNNNSNDARDVKHKLFTKSTHMLLFMDKIKLSDGTEAKIRCIEKGGALLIIMFQLWAYFFIGLMIKDASEAAEKSWNDLSLEISQEYCYNTSAYTEPLGAYYSEIYDYRSLLYNNLEQAGITGDDLPRLLQCSNPVDEVRGYDTIGISVASFSTALGLLFLFLFPDLFESSVLFLCPGIRVKIVSILILLEALFALMAATLGVSMIGAVTNLEAFSVIVGIIFVHEVDEVMRHGVDALYATKRPGLECRFWILLFIYFGIALVPGYFVFNYV